MLGSLEEDDAAVLHGVGLGQLANIGFCKKGPYATWSGVSVQARGATGGCVDLRSREFELREFEGYGTRER